MAATCDVSGAACRTFFGRPSVRPRHEGARLLRSAAVQSVSLRLQIAPLLSDQELATPRSTRVTYWEGACSVSGTRSGRPVSGKSYVELTGYAGRDLP